VGFFNVTEDPRGEFEVLWGPIGYLDLIKRCRLPSSLVLDTIKVGLEAACRNVTQE
jgi:hypothetical protein